MPWDENEQYVRSGHRDSSEFREDSFRTIAISAEEGILAVVGKPKGKNSMEVLSYLFDKGKGWNLEKAKAWFEQHREHECMAVNERFSAVLPFRVMEKIADRPLKIRGIALTAAMSRNFNIYTPEELQGFANKLVSAPIYIEHVAVPNAAGKIARTEWDGQNLWYEAEIYDEDAADKIRKGLIRHVSVGADYETMDVLDGKVPHGLHNAELSLVAVPGVPEANIQILEKLHGQEQAFEPIVAGEYVLGFYQDASAFLPEHFSTVWLDRENGILALSGKLRAQPETQRIQSIFFSKAKMWDESRIQDWLLLHPQYMTPAGDSAPLHTAAVPETGADRKEVLVDRLVKSSRLVVPVEDAVRMITEVLPSPMVERSWGFGPQRLCQELRGVILNLRKEMDRDGRK